jgi:hypothetical protein
LTPEIGKQPLETYMTTYTNIRTTAAIEAAPVLAFVEEHQSALWHASRLIGGYEKARLVDALVQTLQQERRLTRRARIMLDQLLAVLSLDVVDDECPAMGFFVPIDPEDPAVAEICLLTDGLRESIDEAERIRRAFQRQASAEAA